MNEVLIAMGIPTAATGFFFWLLQRHLDKKEKQRQKEETQREAKREEKERNTEQLILFIMQTGRATNVLAEATARAIQRIPDAQCNGDMTAALKKAAEIQSEEKEFLMQQGIKHIFE